MCTWGGNWYLSVKVDIFSEYVVTNLTQSTADCFDEWSTHVKQVEAHFGRQVVAQMITDSAPYFEQRQLQNFNKERGIIHVQSPPYTLELNGIAERTIGTIVAMVRTAMRQSGAPEKAVGECAQAMTYTLNRTQHKAGGRLTRLEKYHNRNVRHHKPDCSQSPMAAHLHLTK